MLQSVGDELALGAALHQLVESRELHVHAVFSGERIKNSHSLVLLCKMKKARISAGLSAYRQIQLTIKIMCNKHIGKVHLILQVH